MNQFREDAAAWCRGKNGWGRALLLLGFGYILFRTLRDPSYCNILWPLNLGFHESGHLLFGFGGRFLGMMGGTLLEGLMPVFGVYYFFRKHDFFAIALCFGWLSTALFSIARYADDAREMAIPLVSLSWDPEIIHDWNFLLTHWGLLKQDHFIALLFRVAAVGSMLVCLGFGFWLVLCMLKSRGESSQTTPAV